jgi:hypothetical protein
MNRAALAALLLLAACGSPPPAAVERKVFVENETEHLRGEQVLAELAAGKLTKDPVGQTAVFFGSGNAINHDLKTTDGVRVVVELDPPIDKRPDAILWKAAVLGRIEAVDLGKRTIRVSAAPVNWRVLEKW